jgi:hypothetical protein
LILIASSNTGLVCGSNIVPEAPSATQVADVLFKAMQHPPPELGEACRPRSIALADTALLEPLQTLLRDKGLETEVFVAGFPDEFYEIIRQLEAHLRGDEPEIPAMLDAPKVTVELLKGVFEAAAEFYRAAPWIRLSNEQVIAVRHPNEHNYHYALVMGQGGVEYGLVRYADWSEVQSQSMYDDDPLLGWQERTWNSLTYDTADHLPFADLDAIEEHKFEIASEEAYPVGIVIEGQRQVRRPTREEWEWYEAALRVIPVVVREHLHSNSRGDYEPIEADISVKTQKGLIKVGVKYPAGELPLEDQPAERLDWGEREVESDEMPAFDRRSMEGVMPAAGPHTGTRSGQPDGFCPICCYLSYRHHPADDRDWVGTGTPEMACKPIAAPAWASAGMAHWNRIRTESACRVSLFDCTAAVVRHRPTWHSIAFARYRRNHDFRHCHSTGLVYPIPAAALAALAPRIETNQWIS